MKKTWHLLLSLSFLFFPLSSCSNQEDMKATEAWEVEDSLLEERRDEKGMVEEFSYVTKDYVDSTGKTEVKKCNVYLPYGYDSKVKYDILYLIHGTDRQDVNHIDTWLETIHARVLLDNMIAKNLIDPLIVVCPTFYSYGLFGDDDMKDVKDMSEVKMKSNQNFIQELRNDILPNVEARYSTYSDGVEEKNFQDSRDHRAIAGLSNGGRLTLIAGMINSFDYFSYFGCYSSFVDASDIIDALNQDKMRGYSLNYMLNADGIFDFAYNGHKKMVDCLYQEGSRWFSKDNTEYVKIRMGYHSERSWRVSLYDSLLRFFK